MDIEIEQLLKENKIHIEYANVDFTAALFQTPKGPVVIVNQNVIEEFIDWAIMHEIGHDKYDHITTGSYQDDFAVHTKMEHNANVFMVSEMFAKYLAQGDVDIEDINPVQFLEQRGLDLSLEPVLKNIIIQRLKEPV